MKNLLLKKDLLIIIKLIKRNKKVKKILFQIYIEDSYYENIRKIQEIRKMKNKKELQFMKYYKCKYNGNNFLAIILIMKKISLDCL